MLKCPVIKMSETQELSREKQSACKEADNVLNTVHTRHGPAT